MSRAKIREEELADVPCSSVVAEAVVCGNAVLIVNGSTPYNAVHGRVPSLLPSIPQVDSPDETTQPSP